MKKEMTKEEIFNLVKSNERVYFVVNNEWAVTRNGNRIGIEHTYYFKGESFDNIKQGISYLNKKVNYLSRSEKAKGIYRDFLIDNVQIRNI